MKILGFEIENSDDVGSEFGNDAEYPNLHNFFKIITVTFRSAIGDVQMPFYKYWEAVIVKYPVLGECMIGFIYLMWFFTIIFNTIVLLNFLISYISEAFEKVLENNKLTLYQNRAWMNQDRLEYMEFFALN